LLTKHHQQKEEVVGMQFRTQPFEIAGILETITHPFVLKNVMLIMLAKDIQ
jgi:hypothetical protein